MALQFFQNKMYSDALHCCTELLANDNSNYSLWYLAGSASFELQDYDLSMNCLYHAISHKSDFDEAYHMLGNIFSIIGETDNALIFWSEAVRINPNSPITLTNMATVYLNKGDLPTAEEYAKKAINLDKKSIDAYRCMQKIYQKYKNYDQMEFFLKKIIKYNPYDPEANFDFAYLLFLRHEYIDAFKHYEYRKKLPSRIEKYNFLPFSEKEIVNSQNLLIYHEQGFGDNIQFARFLPYLENYSISYAIQNGLNRLFQFSFPLIKMVSTVDSNMDFDCCVSSMSIPYELQISDIPNSKYLMISDSDVVEFKLRLGADKFKIGLCWKGSTDNKSNLEIDFFEEIFKFENIQVFSFQTIYDIENNSNIIDLGSKFSDFYDTAVAASCMDIMITIDTAVAHLCGALGLKTIVLVNGDNFDWRWGLNGSQNSVWYQNATILEINKDEPEISRDKFNQILRNVVL